MRVRNLSFSVVKIREFGDLGVYSWGGIWGCGAGGEEVRFNSVKPLIIVGSRRVLLSAAPAVQMATTANTSTTTTKLIDSHLHVWASPKEAADMYPYFPGQEPTLPGHVDFLLEVAIVINQHNVFTFQCMAEASVDGALIVQPINHKFDHSYMTRSAKWTFISIIFLTMKFFMWYLKPDVVLCQHNGSDSVLKKYPTKFVGCCLANPAEDGTGLNQLEHLILKDGYRAVRFNPYLWPPGQQMTNEIGKSMFSKAGELGVPVGFMCMKGLNLHLSEIERLCTEFPSTIVMLDHLAFCKPPTNDEQKLAFSELLKLSRFPQVHIKLSALFRVSRKPYPYEDLSKLLSQVVSSFGANRVMWGSDFPYVVPECGYKEAKEAVSIIANHVPLSSSELEWVMGRTVMQLFQGHWLS
ncbi:hypothetical protein C3L33_13835, partial [Rhododendron williamsianum]